MSIRKYIAYLKTIETGSITHAAAQLGYTQSAISRMIADLEDSWGVKLLTRNRSGIEISSEGLTLLPKLQAICKDYEDLNYAISELHGLSSGSIRLGAFSSISSGRLPQIIKSFHELYPHIDFQLVNGEYNQIATWLRKGLVDCGFVSLPAPNDLEASFLLQTTWWSFCRKTIPWPTPRCIRWSACPARTSSTSRRSRTTKSPNSWTICSRSPTSAMR